MSSRRYPNTCAYRHNGLASKSNHMTFVPFITRPLGLVILGTAKNPYEGGHFGTDPSPVHASLVR
jgi:hypothetical protein